jgi:aminopeptidase N
MACKLDVTKCVQTAKAYFNDWMNNPKVNSIPATLRATAYCAAIKNGELAEFEFLFGQLKSGGSANLKSDLITGLACSNKAWQLEKFLNDRLENIDDVLVALRNVINRSPSFLTAWGFIKTNWDKLNEK